MRLKGKIAVVGLLALALAAAGLTSTAVSAKKKGGSKTFTETKAVNVLIPDFPAAGVGTPLTSTITIPKKYKGKVVGDVNVTGFQTTGDVADAANDLRVNLRAPDGRSVQLFQFVGDQSLGPWTLDDDTRTSRCNDTTLTCEDPDATLLPPFAGTSNLLDTSNGTGSQGSGPLSAFNGVRMRGTWTLTVLDTDNSQSSVLNSWGLAVKPAKPVDTAKKKTFAETKTVNATITDQPVSGPPIAVTSDLTVPKKYKKQVVGDLDLTGIQTTGDLPNAANDLGVKLTAPNGRTVSVFDGIGNQNIGPLTLDDDTPQSICDSATPTCEDPQATLIQPFAGTANLNDLGAGGTGPLSAFDGVKMRGTWTLTIFDDDGSQISVLNTWGLRIKPAKPAPE